MKQYRHKSTGNIAVETHSGNNYRVTVPQNYTVPKWIVENSDEWEEYSDYDGVKFYAKLETHTVYTIKKYDLRNKFFNVFWKNDLEYLDFITYKKEDIEKYFKDGTWIKIEENELQKSLCIQDLRKADIQISVEQHEKLLETLNKDV